MKPEYYNRVRGIVQVGAAIGEEVDEWETYEIKHQLLIEPLPDQFSKLKLRSESQHHNPDVKCLNIALSDYDGFATFYVSQDHPDSSSLLQFDRPLAWGPGVEKVIEVPVRRYSSLVYEEMIDPTNYNLLFLDAQGSEANLIRGADKYIQNFDYIFSEVSFVPLYKDIMLWPDFRDYVESLGFELVGMKPLNPELAHLQGEAFFIRNGT